MYFFNNSIFLQLPTHLYISFSLPLLLGASIYLESVPSEEHQILREAMNQEKQTDSLTDRRTDTQTKRHTEKRHLDIMADIVGILDGCWTENVHISIVLSWCC